MTERKDRSSVECLEERRYLAPSEVLQYQFNRMQPQVGTYFHVNTFNSSVAVQDEHVKKSLHDLSKLHFFLHARIDEDKEGNPYFCEMENDSNSDSDWVNFRCLTLTSTSEWPAVVSEEFTTHLDFVHGPLWRAIWVTCPCNEFDQFVYMLIFICSHCIIDAMSATDLFANQFIPILNQYITDQPLASPSERPIKFPKSQEEIFNNHEAKKFNDYTTPWYLRCMLDAVLWFGDVTDRLNKSPDMKVVQEKQDFKSPYYFPFKIDPQASIKLQELCKTHSVSVHSVLTILLTYAFKMLEKDYPLYRATCKNVIFPINMRKFNGNLSTSPMPLGQYISSGAVKARLIDPRNKAEFFQYAQKVTKQLKDKNDVNKQDDIVSTLTYLLKNGRLLDVQTMFLSNAIHLSNIGNCNAFIRQNPDSKIQLTEQYFSVALNAYGIFVTTSTVNKQMFFCIGFAAGWLTDDFAEVLSRNFLACVDHLVAS